MLTHSQLAIWRSIAIALSEESHGTPKPRTSWPHGLPVSSIRVVHVEVVVIGDDAAAIAVEVVRVVASDEATTAALRDESPLSAKSSIAAQPIRTGAYAGGRWLE